MPRAELLLVLGTSLQVLFHCLSLTFHCRSSTLHCVSNCPFTACPCTFTAFHLIFYSRFHVCRLPDHALPSPQVQPFAGLVDWVGPAVPRVLMNRELAGPWERWAVEVNFTPAALCVLLLYCRCHTFFQGPLGSLVCSSAARLLGCCSSARLLRVSSWVSLRHTVLTPPPSMPRRRKVRRGTCTSPVHRPGSCKFCPTVSVSAHSWRIAGLSGDCDDTVLQLAEACGWGGELAEMVGRADARW